MSRAVKAPIIIVSNKRKAIIYSLTLVVIDSQLATIQIKESRAVKTTSKREIPSIPREYEIPRDEIQICFSVNWNPILVGSKLNQRYKEIKKVINDAHAATARAFADTTSGAPRTDKIKTTPIRGRHIRTLRMGQSIKTLP